MKKISFKIMVLAIVLTVTLSACARQLGASSYTSSSVVGKVLEGTVVSARSVTVRNFDRYEKNVKGGAAGGVTGAAAGGSAHEDDEMVQALGAIAGALLGAAVENHLGTQEGMEYIVRVDPKYVNKVKKNEAVHTNVTVGSKSIQDEIKDSIDFKDTETTLISVIQGSDVIIKPGQHVLIIYHDDRPRIVPAAI